MPSRCQKEAVLDNHHLSMNSPIRWLADARACYAHVAQPENQPLKNSSSVNSASEMLMSAIDINSFMAVGENLATSLRQGGRKLRFIHAGAPLQTALTGFATKLKHGSATGALVRAQTAPAAS